MLELELLDEETLLVLLLETLDDDSEELELLDTLDVDELELELVSSTDRMHIPALKAFGNEMAFGVVLICSVRIAILTPPRQ